MKKPDKKPASGAKRFEKFINKSNPKVEKRNDRRREKKLKGEAKKGVYPDLRDPMRLNRFIAMAGLCSRREADDLIAKGKIKVNGVVVTEMGHKVMVGEDEVTFGSRKLRITKFLYLLMNKPKNLISTLKDEKGRPTVLKLLKKYTKARLYPVGRLDRATTGLLLFTNDGELAARITHPSKEVPKVYHVTTDIPVTEEHLKVLKQGVELEDGPMKADKIGYIDGGTEHEVGIRIHSGRNRVVRRMFEHLGYEVIALDRVQLGPLDKKGLPRGQCRFLTDKEVGFLKML